MKDSRKLYFCWRCEKEMPFFNEDEWRQAYNLYDGCSEQIAFYRNLQGNEREAAMKTGIPEAISKFEKLVGLPIAAFHHHRRSAWGPECKKCGHLFRTSKASFCANCGNH